MDKYVANSSEAGPPIRRALVLMTASSFLVPAAGLLTQPILAQALGVSGRGQLAAANAPAMLAVAIATLGLPDALTYYLAKQPHITRRALLWASVVSSGLGLVCLLLAYLTLPFLSAGDARLGRLILLGMALAIPTLVVGAFRGAAIGHQMWNTVAMERLVNTSLRVFAYGTLWMLGQLTVTIALIVGLLSPILAGFIYLRLLWRPRYDQTEPKLQGGAFRLLVSYGNRVWLGSVASMFLARAAEILMVPLSSVEDLGFYSVASTISDLPLIIALAIAGALFGVNSKSMNAVQHMITARLTLLASFMGCIMLGATVQLWIAPLFGSDFKGAVIPTLMLLFSALVCIPGLMAATGIGAWGRPGLRSIGLAVALIVNISMFMLLVPPFGVVGACWTSILSNLVMSSYMVITASRVMRVPVRGFLLVRGADVARTWQESTRLLARVRTSVRHVNP